MLVSGGKYTFKIILKILRTVENVGRSVISVLRMKRILFLLFLIKYYKSYLEDVKVKDFEAVSSWCKQNDVAMVVVGPEDPLAQGIADFLQEQGKGCLLHLARRVFA